MGSLASLLWATVFGVVGLAYFVYEKKQHLFVPLLCGMGLMTFPYFISNAIILFVVGLGLSAVPYFFRDSNV